MSIKLGGNSPKKITMRTASRLPAEYQEVEYIESTGTQYFTVGTSFKTSYKIEIDLEMTATLGDYVPVGVRNSSNYKIGINVWQSYFKIIAGADPRTNTIAEDTNRHTVIIDKSTATVDGINYSISNSNSTFSYGLGVFYYNIGSTPSTFSNNKLYKLDIYDENGTHIYDLVPCYRKADSVIGMYDLVNDVFYTNQGSGTFTKGNDVNFVEQEIKRVTIRPNGTEKQIRPTGWTPGANTVAYYPLTSVTTIHEQSGKNKDLTNTGVTFGTYKGVDCAYLDGSHFLKNETSYGLSGNFTALIWVYYIGINSYPQPRFYGDGNGNIGIRVWGGPGGNVIGYNPKGAETSTALTSDGGWKLLTVTYDGANCKLYVDSNNVDTTAKSGYTYTDSKLGIGGYIPSPLYWEGGLSEFILENKARTAQEISDYYNLTKGNYGL